MERKSNDAKVARELAREFRETVKVLPELAAAGSDRAADLARRAARLAGDLFARGLDPRSL